MILKPRVKMGHFLLRLGRVIQSLAIMVMRPDDLVEFSRKFYSNPEELFNWCNEEMVDQGLNPLEEALLREMPLKTGRLLLLDVGGGREAIPLAKAGFEVSGVDFIPEMVHRAQENAARHGVNILGIVQEISKLNLPEGSYDIAWLANSMYSSIPTRKRRLDFLRRVHQALKPGGYFFCSFHWEMKRQFSRKVELSRKAFAYLTLGNLSYEPGDILWGGVEFIHAFSLEAELKSEFTAGGFTVANLFIPESGVEGGALLKAKK